MNYYKQEYLQCDVYDARKVKLRYFVVRLYYIFVECFRIVEVYSRRLQRMSKI